jgi:predicted lipid-binding transport protein (Tim44 family)
LVIVLLILAAFALGWWGRGRRIAAQPASPVDGELDQALQVTLIAYQAALSLWQARAPDGSAPSSPALARQSVDVFERRRLALAAIALGPEASPEAAAAHARALGAASRLGDGLAAFADGAPLDRESERALASAERALISARLELQAAGRNGALPG